MKLDLLFLVVRQQEKEEDDVDIGIVPSQGLVPPTLRISDLERSKISETKPNYSYASPATKRSYPQDMTSITQQVNSQVRSNMVKKKHLLINLSFNRSVNYRTGWTFSARFRGKFSFFSYLSICCILSRFQRQ